MSEFEIICLANSRKRQGRCIAGIRTDGQGWLRPVGWTKDGGLTANNYWLDDNSEPKILDVIRLGCARPHPKPYHPEDWILGPSAWRLLNRPAVNEHLDLLRKHLISGPALFGNTQDRIPAAQFKICPAASSLALIEPENLRWDVRDNKGKRRITAQFSLCGAVYALGLTDPVYEQKLNRLTFGNHPRSAASIPDSATVWLTVSTSEPFQKEPGAEAFCYKLVAAVIIAPGSEPGAASFASEKALPPAPFPNLADPATMKPKSERKAALQTVYARNYEAWSDTEDERLIVMGKNGMTAEAIARLLQRSESAVVSRLGKLVLEKYRNLL